MATKVAKKKVPKAGKGKRETTETVDVPVPISADELARYSQDFVKKSLEVDQHVTEKRLYLSGWRERHEALKEEHDELRSIVTEKAKPKTMKCIVVKDFDRGIVKYLDPKTRRELHQRDITKEDEQLNIEGTEPPRTAGAHVTDKPPGGRDGKKLVGTTKENDVELPGRPAPMWEDGKKEGQA